MKLSIQLSTFALMILFPVAIGFAQESGTGNESDASTDTRSAEEVDAQQEGEARPTESLTQQVRQMIVNGEIRDAVAQIEAYIAGHKQEIDSLQVQQSYAMVVTGFTRTRNPREAYKTMKQLLDFQINRLDSGDENIRPSGNVRTLLATAPLIGKADEINGVIDRALAAVEAATADSTDSQRIIELVNLRSIKALALIREEKRDEAVELLLSEHATVKKLFEENPEDEMILAVYVRSLSNLMRLTGDEKDGEDFYAEHQAILRERLDQKPDNISFAAQYIAGLVFEVNRTLVDQPEQALELVKEGETVLGKLEEVNENGARALQNVQQQLTALKRRGEARLVVVELIDKPAPGLDADYWLNGAELADADRQGKVVMLDFWAVWCGPCIRTFPKLKDLHENYHDQGLQIIGVTRHFGIGWDEESETPRRERGIDAESENQAIEAFMQKHELPYPSIVTPQQSAMNTDYGVSGIPHVVLIDKKGNVRMIKVGATEENAKELEAKIRELLAE